MSKPEIQIAEETGSRVSAWFFWTCCALLTAMYLCCALVRIADLPLMDPDEPRYAGAGRHMAQGGSLLVPEFNGEPRINKPPLFYWLVALSDKLAGGATETSSRMPSVAFGLIMLWGTIFLGRRVFDAATGLIGGLALATMPLFIGLSRLCITDMTLSTFMAAALGALMLGMIGRAAPTRALWIAAVLFGFAVLTKATAAFAVLLAVVIDRAMSLPKERRPSFARWIPHALIAAMIFSAGAMYCDSRARAVLGPKLSKNSSSTLRIDADGVADENGGEISKNSAWETADSVLSKASLAIAIGVVALLLVIAYRTEKFAPALPRGWTLGLALSISMGLWWYLLLIASQGWTRFTELLEFEINQRVAGAVHRQGMYFYLLMIPALTFPWSVGLIGALGAAWPGDAGDARGRLARRADGFLVAWVAGIVFFFSIPGAKLETYVLAALPALGLLTARFLLRLRSSSERVGGVWILATRSMALIAAAAIFALPFFARSLAKNDIEPLAAGPVVLWAVAIAGAAAVSGSWLLALRGRVFWGAAILGGVTAAAIFLMAPVIIERQKARTAKAICAQSGDAIKDCKRISSLGVSPEGLSYYLEHPVVDVQIFGFHWRHPAADSTRFDVLAKAIGTDDFGAIFIERGNAPRIFGKGVDLGQLNDAEFKKRLPANWVCVYFDRNVFVIRNARK